MTTINEQPLLSVITVTLNDLEGLKKTVDSLEEQEFQDYEHLIIDGGSRDGTILFLNKNQNNRKMNWISETDRGIFDAMNKGLNLARGKFVVFMNSGDRFKDGKTVLKVMEDYSNFQWDWAFGKVNLVDLDGTILKVFNERKLTINKLKYGFGFAPHPSTFYKKSFVEQLGYYDLAYDFASDQEFAIRAFQKSKPKILEFIISDFLEGGIHSRQSPLRREILYHNMRVKNGIHTFNSVFFDLVISLMILIYRKIRTFFSSILKIHCK